MVAPTLKRKSEEFSIYLKGEDIWGNPSNQCEKTFYINSNVKVSRLPEKIKIIKGDYFIAINGLKIENECECIIDFLNDQKKSIVKTNLIVQE